MRARPGLAGEGATSRSSAIPRDASREDVRPGLNVRSTADTPPRRRERWRPGPAPLGEQRRRSIARAPRPPPGHPERRRPRPRSLVQGTLPGTQLEHVAEDREPPATADRCLRQEGEAAETDTGEALYVSSTSVAPRGAPRSPYGATNGCRPRGRPRLRPAERRSARPPPPRQGRARRDGAPATRWDPPFAPRRAEREAHALQALGNNIGGPDSATSRGQTSAPPPA